MALKFLSLTKDRLMESCRVSVPAAGFFTPAAPVVELNCQYSPVAIWLVIFSLALALIIVGAILHNLYPWSNQSQWVGYWTPTNESVWEHLKLIYVPFVVLALILWFFLAPYLSNYVLALAVAVVVACLLIVLVFYTIEGAFGLTSGSTWSLIIDILIFVAAVLTGVLIFYAISTASPLPFWTELIAWLILVIFGLLLVLWSYQAPNIPLFQETS